MIASAPGVSAAHMERAPAETGLALDDLRERYQAYRRRQAARLVHLLPTEAIRPLYRQAAGSAAPGGGDPGADPLARLVALCEKLLPLPPFEVWCEDFRANPSAYFDDLAEAAAGSPTEAEPSTVDVRRLHYDGAEWTVRLRGWRDGPSWKGHLAFRSGAGPDLRTAAIFREDDLWGVRRRFHEFDEAALQAFLRSTLP